MSRGIAWVMRRGEDRRSYAVIGSTLYRWTDLPGKCEVYYSATWLAHRAASKQTARDEEEGFVMSGKPHHLSMDDRRFAVEAVDQSRTEDETRSAVGALINIIMIEGRPV